MNEKEKAESLRNDCISALYISNECICNYMSLLKTATCIDDALTQDVETIWETFKAFEKNVNSLMKKLRISPDYEKILS